MSINTTILSGNIGTDPELKVTGSGTSVLKFRLAGRAGFGDNEKPVWVTCTLWGKRADGLAPHLSKGMPVCVSGELSIDEWTNKDGEARTTVEVRVDGIQFTGGGKGGNPETEHERQKKNGYAPGEKEPDDDIPF